MADPTAALFGARVSVLTAIAAATAAGVSPDPLEAVWGGVRLVDVVFGAVGAAVTLSVVQDWGWAKVLTTLVCGLAAAGFGTQVALHYLPPPEALRTISGSAYAALLGAVGVYAIPGVHLLAKSFAANPFAVVDWARGKGGPPTPPQPPTGGQP